MAARSKDDDLHRSFSPEGSVNRDMRMAGLGPPYPPDVSFSPMMPATISPMHTRRAAVAGSWNSHMPTNAVPTAPMPTQIT